MILSQVRYIEVPDCPAIPDHPAWWLPVIWGSVIVGAIFLVALGLLVAYYLDYRKEVKKLEAPERGYLDIDERLKKLERWTSGGGP